MKFCPECGANWQNQYSDTCAACGYKLPQAMSPAPPATYTPPVQPAPPQEGPYAAPAPVPYTGAPLPQSAPVPLSQQPAPLFGQEAPQPGAVGAPAPLFQGTGPITPPQGTGPIVPPQGAPSLFGEEVRRAAPPAPLFEDTALLPPTQDGPSLFDEAAHTPAPPPQQRSAAAKAANLQALLEAEDDIPGFEPTPPPARGGYDAQGARPYPRAHYEESYEDDYAPTRPPRSRSGGRSGGGGADRGRDNRPRADRPRDDRGRKEPPRGPRDEYGEEYEEREPRRNGGGNGGRSKGLVILAVVLAVAVVATLAFAVLYLGGFLDGGGKTPETSSLSAPTSASAGPETQVPSSPSDFATQLTTAEISDIISEFYQSYLQCINQGDLAPLTRATELCRAEVETRMQKSGNKENQFNFIGATCDEQSIQYGEDNGRPAIVFNAKFEYSYRPRADANAEYANDANYQTVQLVYEQYQWKVNRFVLINATEYENHTVASFA